MAQSIQAVHAALATIVGQLSIDATDTYNAQAVKVAWPYVPPARQVIVPPSAVVLHDLTGVEFGVGGMVRQNYDLHVQFFAAESASILNIGADIANAFLDELVTALSDNITLGGTVQVVKDLRGSGQQRETLAVLEWGDKRFVGFDVVIPINLTDVRARSA